MKSKATLDVAAAGRDAGRKLVGVRARGGAQRPRNPRGHLPRPPRMSRHLQWHSQALPGVGGRTWPPRPLPFCPTPHTGRSINRWAGTQVKGRRDMLSVCSKSESDWGHLVTERAACSHLQQSSWTPRDEWTVSHKLRQGEAPQVQAPQPPARPSPEAQGLGLPQAPPTASAGRAPGLGRLLQPWGWHPYLTMGPQPVW